MWLIDSSIGRKLIMSITGVLLVLFLLFHSIMNFVVLISLEGYNAICEFLGANWYAVAATSVLAGGFIVHILYALYLSYQNNRARGAEAYGMKENQKGITWASNNMLVLGVVVLGFLGLHLYQFWSKMMFVELSQMGDLSKATDGAFWVNFYFSQPVYAILYIVWLVALWFHLTHGIWSALQTTGMNNKTWLPRVKAISNVISTIIILLFMAVPVYYLLGCGAC